MKKTPLFLLLGLCGFGLLSGYSLRWITRGPATARVAPGPEIRKSIRAASQEVPVIPATSRPTAPAVPRPKSTDTLETLLAPDDGTLYTRLAAWLMDASEEDIAAYWAGYQKGTRSNDLTDLVFLNWTRLSPRGAIAATAGGKDEHYAWWAWASHDPEKALAAAIADGPDRINNVTWGIGEFHPEWLRDNFERIPESGRSNAISGFSKWEDAENPLEALKFMKEHDMGFDQGTFKVLARKDPWAALDWIKENHLLKSDPFSEGSNAMDILLATMGSERPDDLEQLAAQTPSGLLKRKMEATLFDNLLATDPAAALEQAKATEVPLVAAERLAKVGLSLAKSDPEKAFEMAASIFEVSPGKWSYRTRITYGQGSTDWGSSESAADELLATLLVKDPDRVLDLAARQLKPEADRSQAFGNLANQWANQDLVGYTHWVNKQTDPLVREYGTSQVINQLTQQGQYAEAIEWSMSSEKVRTSLSIPYQLSQWERAEPGAATQWLETAEMPDEERARLQENFERISKQKEE